MIYYKNKAINIKYKGKSVKKYLINSSVILNIHEFETKPDEIFVLKDTNNPLYRELIWTSSDDTVATVNDFGEVKILSEGVATIRCTNAYGKYDECVFTVFNKDYTRTINYYSTEELMCCKYSISAEDYNDGIWKARKHETYTKSDGTVIGSEDVQISGDVVKNNDYIIFDGTQNIDLSFADNLYGWSSVSNTTKSDYIWSIELEFSEFVNKNIHVGININTEGYINSSLYQLEFNKKYRLIIMKRRSYYNTYTGFCTRIIVSSNNTIEYDSGWGTIAPGSGHWVEGLYLLNKAGFKGKLYNLKLFITEVNKKNLSAEDADAKDVMALDNPIVNNYLVEGIYRITAPKLDSVSRYTVHDLATNNKPKVMIRVLSNDEIVGDDKSINKYDLIQFEHDGSIQKIYKNVLSATNGRYVEFDLPVNIPYRDYMYFGLYDRDTKTIQKSELFSIRTTDSRIDKSNYNANGDEVIAKQMYISPATLVGRSGDKKLLRATFVPEQVANIKIKYRSTNTNVATVGENDGIVELISPGVCEIIAVSQSNTKVIAKSVVTVRPSIYESEKTTINLNDYNITMSDGTESNNWEAAWANTLGINAALKDLKSKGYKQIKLPEGHYYMACENMNTRNVTTINPPSNIIFDITNCTIEQVMSECPDTRVIMIDNADKTKILNGTIIGDLFIHNYGLRINENGDMLEEGSYSTTDGTPINPDKANGETYKSLDAVHDAGSYYRLKDFITCYEDYETAEPEPIPTKFTISPLWKTCMNTVDGGQVYTYYYNDENSLLGYETGGFGKVRTMPEGATKLKMSFRSEEWDKGIYLMTKRNAGSHATFEFGTGIGFRNSFDSEINGTVIMNCQGDVSMTCSSDTLVCDARWINCTMKEARRQGISFVATGENYLILDSSIGNINGVDPQCGIDMEAYGRNEKFLFKNVTFHDNRKWDMVDCFSGDVEIDSCTFNGAIGLGQESYNWYVHDCNFIYDDKYNRNSETSDEWTRRYKIHNVAGCNLPMWITNKYTYAIIENNYFNGGKNKSLAFATHAYTRNAYSLNNNIENGNSLVFDNNSYNDKIQCNNITIHNGVTMYNPELTSYPGHEISITFEGSSISPKITSDDKATHIIEADNSTVGAGSAAKTIGILENYTIKNYSVNGKTSGLVIVKNCDIINNDDISVIGSTFSNTTCFKNCNISIPRKQCGWTYVGGGQGSCENYEYVGITFEDCEIEIRDVESTNNTASIDMFRYGYGDFKCPVILRRCHIKGSDKKTVLNTVQTEDCTFEGGATRHVYTQLTDITLPESLDVVINTQTQIPVTLTPSITRRIFWELPEGLHMTITADNKITCTKLGTYTIVAKSYDGSKIRKSMTINVIEAPTQETV